MASHIKNYIATETALTISNGTRSVRSGMRAILKDRHNNYTLGKHLAGQLPHYYRTVESILSDFQAEHSALEATFDLASTAPKSPKFRNSHCGEILCSHFVENRLGYMSFLATKWIEGIPLANFQTDHGASFGRMISNIYGRMQYLLPWGLFGMHELIQYEAKNREISVGDGVSSLSILTAEGVPNFDALQLVLQLGVERVDATRLSQQYRRFRPHTDIVGWFVATGWPALERTVRGQDRRRVDPALRGLHAQLKKQASQTS